MANDHVVEASLGLGGNIGDVTDSLIRALLLLKDSRGVELRRVSSIYRTPPWGKLDQPAFLNMAALVETTLPARALLALCLDVEKSLGRLRLERWGPRTVDIDVLTYGDFEIVDPDLEIPHPRIADRAFVLAPLGEILPELRIGGHAVTELLSHVDRSGIEVNVDATRVARVTLDQHFGRL